MNIYDSIIVNIIVPLDSDVETEMIEINDILHNSELGKMKDELLNDTIIEASFHKTKANCYRLHRCFGKRSKV